MSYSFTVRAATAAGVLVAAAAEFDKICESQPIHEADRAHALATLETFVGLVDHVADHDFSASVHGSVSASTTGELRSASVGVNVWLTERFLRV
jgi:hypothetical protein